MWFKLQELGPGCPQFILTQTPMQNTLEDYWSMIWSQKSRVAVCLHTTNEVILLNIIKKKNTFDSYFYCTASRPILAKRFK